MWNVFRVNRKDTRMTSLTLFWFLQCSADLVHSSGVFVGGFERVNSGPVDEL